MVGACLFPGGYLFYAFFLVTQGGLNEVKRHLKAMSVGDLTTSPNPWGKDEAAALMHLEQTAAAASALKDQALNLATKVTQFKLPAEG